MASEMILRLADALVAAFDDQSGPGTYVGNSDGIKCVQLDGCFDFLEIAQAAIKAMREPTEAMTTKVPEGDVTAWTWRNMIDEALRDGP